MTTPAQLNATLFEQLGRINNATKDTLPLIMEQTKAMEMISEQIVKNNNVRLGAVTLISKYKGMSGAEPVNMPTALT